MLNQNKCNTLRLFS